jgi:hypothetical protein
VEFWSYEQNTATSTVIDSKTYPELFLLAPPPRLPYQGPMPARSSAFAKRRHGFQQMARLPCYRGSRTR